MCSSLTIAYIPTRLSPMDDSNKLVAVSSNISKTTFGGIASKRDDGGFLAVQERRKSNSTGTISCWFCGIPCGAGRLCTFSELARLALLK